MRSFGPVSGATPGCPRRWEGRLNVCLLSRLRRANDIPAEPDCLVRTPLIAKSINDAIRKDDAETAKASRAKAPQQQQPKATHVLSPFHHPSSLHTPEPKVSTAVSADHDRDDAQTMQQRIKAQDEGWDDGYG